MQKNNKTKHFGFQTSKEAIQIANRVNSTPYRLHYLVTFQTFLVLE